MVVHPIAEKCIQDMNPYENVLMPITNMAHSNPTPTMTHRFIHLLPTMLVDNSTFSKLSGGFTELNLVCKPS